MSKLSAWFILALSHFVVLPQLAWAQNENLCIPYLRSRHRPQRRYNVKEWPDPYRSLEDYPRLGRMLLAAQTVLEEMWQQLQSIGAEMGIDSLLDEGEKGNERRNGIQRKGKKKTDAWKKKYELKQKEQQQLDHLSYLTQISLNETFRSGLFPSWHKHSYSQGFEYLHSGEDDLNYKKTDNVLNSVIVNVRDNPIMKLADDAMANGPYEKIDNGKGPGPPSNYPSADNVRLGDIVDKFVLKIVSENFGEIFHDGLPPYVTKLMHPENIAYANTDIANQESPYGDFKRRVNTTTYHTKDSKKFTIFHTMDLLNGGESWMFYPPKLATSSTVDKTLTHSIGVYLKDISSVRKARRLASCNADDYNQCPGWLRTLDTLETETDDGSSDEDHPLFKMRKRMAAHFPTQDPQKRDLDKIKATDDTVVAYLILRKLFADFYKGKDLSFGKKFKSRQPWTNWTMVDFTHDMRRSFWEYMLEGDQNFEKAMSRVEQNMGFLSGRTHELLGDDILFATRGDNRWRHKKKGQVYTESYLFPKKNSKKLVAERVEASKIFRPKTTPHMEQLARKGTMAKTKQGVSKSKKSKSDKPLLSPRVRSIYRRILGKMVSHLTSYFMYLNGEIEKIEPSTFSIFIWLHDKWSSSHHIPNIEADPLDIVSVGQMDAHTWRYFQYASRFAPGRTGLSELLEWDAVAHTGKGASVIEPEDREGIRMKRFNGQLDFGNFDFGTKDRLTSPLISPVNPFNQSPFSGRDFLLWNVQNPTDVKGMRIKDRILLNEVDVPLVADETYVARAQSETEIVSNMKDFGSGGQGSQEKYMEVLIELFGGDWQNRDRDYFDPLTGSNLTDWDAIAGRKTTEVIGVIDSSYSTAMDGSTAGGASSSGIGISEGMKKLDVLSKRSFRERMEHVYNDEGRKGKAQDVVDAANTENLLDPTFSAGCYFDNQVFPDEVGGNKATGHGDAKHSNNYDGDSKYLQSGRKRGVQFIEFGFANVRLEGSSTNSNRLWKKRFCGLYLDGSFQNSTINLHMYYLDSKNIAKIFENHHVPRMFEPPIPNSIDLTHEKTHNPENWKRLLEKERNFDFTDPKLVAPDELVVQPETSSKSSGVENDENKKRRKPINTRDTLEYISIDIDTYDLFLMESILKGGFRPKIITVEYQVNFVDGMPFGLMDPSYAADYGYLKGDPNDIKLNVPVHMPVSVAVAAKNRMLFESNVVGAQPRTSDSESRDSGLVEEAMANWLALDDSPEAEYRRKISNRETRLATQDVFQIEEDGVQKGGYMDKNQLERSEERKKKVGVDEIGTGFIKIKSSNGKEKWIHSQHTISGKVDDHEQVEDYVCDDEMEEKAMEKAHLPGSGVTSIRQGGTSELTIETQVEVKDEKTGETKMVTRKLKTGNTFTQTGGWLNDCATGSSVDAFNVIAEKHGYVLIGIVRFLDLIYLRKDLLDRACDRYYYGMEEEDEEDQDDDVDLKAVFKKLRGRLNYAVCKSYFTVPPQSHLQQEYFKTSREYRLSHYWPLGNFVRPPLRGDLVDVPTLFQSGNYSQAAAMAKTRIRTNPMIRCMKNVYPTL